MREAGGAGSAGAGAVNTEAHVQLLGLGLDGCDGTPSVLLVFDKARFLFNAGEGFQARPGAQLRRVALTRPTPQRFCVEHRLRVTRLQHIFLTRAEVGCSNGLPGLFLTMADVAAGAGQPPLNIALTGPPRVEALQRAIGTVVGNARHCRVTATALRSGSDSVVYQDAAVRISHVLLSPDCEPPAPDEGAKRLRLEGGEYVRGAAREAAAAADGESVCYLAVLADVPGKFDVAKAEALGVPRGPMRGQLCQGNSVVVGGVTVEASDVCSPPTPGPALIILDLPTQAHLDAALAKLPQDAAVAAAAQRTSLVVHLSPHALTLTPAYAALTQALGGPATTHVFANPQAAQRPLIFRSSAAVATRLSFIQPQVFPPIRMDGDTQPQPAAAVPVEGYVAGENLLRWKLRPLASAGLDRSSVPLPLATAALRLQVATDAPSLARLVEGIQRDWAGQHAGGAVPPAVAALALDRAAAPELLFLGTGAAIPSKYRNVSGILFRSAGAGGLLLDCGEGSLGQLRRRLGEEGTREALRSLRCAWISHIHADHHLGLLSLLAARRAALGGAAAPPLPVVGPAPLRRLLELHGSGVEPLACAFVDLADTTAARQAAFVADQGRTDGAAALAPPHYPLFLAACQLLGLARLHSVPVVHCAHAYAAVLEGAAGWKVVYSGDTRPCDQLVAAAQGASVLVHEATFEDALADEARLKKHSLTREAVATGAKAGAYRTLLTHFSQRYPKIPVMDASFADSTAIAFDMMTLNLADLPALPTLLPALRALFPEQAPPEDADDVAGVYGGPLQE